ncbi:hypothetical protein GUITHDRAFT_76565 [Guillardia theta CCMP2712]|uniref:Bestrophin homolog n=1 Tax=Guillardia theta (strain CCMP2712) TaxID=905079 RepID=L1ITK4_GUITC|nr:hypothetical protein GUITHDRAFT_76565 [Guillardia theta CCMP2712]EKX39214.1 hypothetical protein GUITHDRAFT_76565 [Guillardia theta CCMP2712]|eukprot:XP_005826194.1 hypothetical protein GUITHDRAFT_76565 [Guillardia theta CCMP2712]
MSASSNRPLSKAIDPSKLLNGLYTDDDVLISDLTSRSRANWAKDLLSVASSRVLARISQRMTITTAWAAYVTALITWGDYLAPPSWGSFTQFTVPGWPHELVGAFLSILLVFRTDQAYDRFWEGRKQWSSLNSQCRSISRLVLSNLPIGMAQEFLSLVALFPVALKQHLRGDRNERELAAVFHLFQPKNVKTLEIVLESKNMPMTVVWCMSQLSAPLRKNRASRIFNYEVLWEEMEEKLSELADIVSQCEKIKCTPLPLSYSRHTSRFFSLFLFSLPLALVKETSPLLVPTIVLTTSWVLFATEEIGHIIEEPFGTIDSKSAGRRTQRQSSIMVDLEMWRLVLN